MGLEVISNDQTAASPITVPSGETNLKTVDIKANSYKLVLVRAVIKIASTGTSAAQNVTFKVKAGVTTGNSRSFVYVSKAIVSTEFITLETMARCNEKDACRVTIQGAGADANTTVTCESMVVLGLY